ncbi:hypothetical protein LAV84_22880 [Rhizobium sp. VS19-DR104.2]|uniref:hypothetical protein n=1 Tax=unclassified Rhizobium TaxID=2613769 RepID=UPI001CC4D6C9|nr:MULTISPECIES: hypothetical protein [unclassified Rhizobium]MBZ5761923.1 hypothetical protein [Rhizobium sp. VS19-DR96]MBZ5768896.1 hypothetical protein [Rhizobium sp. VS19-DR129.2]MBZ5775700.1 hypothetical protein [Rhizobium sp. VS19-DRK62.2]MBZ5786802.1 hypothetical protein [Rhizobium sp. VS19-DR121]MBZ5805012.1 hypothetical protein [Rhizobium sp. VS19-DR181]
MAEADLNISTRPLPHFLEKDIPSFAILQVWRYIPKVFKTVDAARRQGHDDSIKTMSAPQDVQCRQSWTCGRGPPPAGCLVLVL